MTDKQARKAERRVAKELAQSKRVAISERDVDDRSRVSKVWWAVPIGLLSLIVIAPLTIGLVVWYRNRRAMRAFERA